MAFGNGKYEGVNPIDKLHPGEPYFFIRAQDRNAASAVRLYAELLRLTGEKKGCFDVLEFASKIERWQRKNNNLVKTPD